MGWVKKGNSYYFYRSELINGKVKTTYCGKYPTARDYWNGTIPKELEPSCIFTKEFLIKADNLIKTANTIYQYCLLLTGHHLDCNGKWRKAKKSLLIEGFIPIYKQRYYPRCKEIRRFIENPNIVKDLKTQLDQTLSDAIDIINSDSPQIISQIYKGNVLYDLTDLDNPVCCWNTKYTRRKICDIDKLLMKAFNLIFLLNFFIPFQLRKRTSITKNKTYNVYPYNNFSNYRRAHNKLITFLKLSNRTPLLLEPIESIFLSGLKLVENLTLEPRLLVQPRENNKFAKYKLDNVESILRYINCKGLRYINSTKASIKR